MITRIFDLLENYRKNFPDKRDAFAKKEKDGWIPFSTEQYLTYSDYISYALLENGIEKNDCVITITNNRPEWNFVDMGLAQIGAVHVPLYPTINTKSYDYIILQCQPVAIFVANHVLYEKIAPLLNNHPSVKFVYSFEKIKSVAHWSRLLEIGEKAENKMQKELLAIKDSIQPDDLVTIIYTSGTTGNPKGVMLSHSNFISNVLASAASLNLDSSHKTLSFLPINHVYERMVNYQYQYKGISIYYAESMDTIGDNLRELKPHGFATVPRLLEKVYDKIMAKGKSQPFLKKAIFLWAVNLGQKYELNRANGWWYEFKLKIARKLVFSKWQEALGGNIKFMCSGGAPLQIRLERLFWAAGIPVQEGYGLTETSPIISANQNSYPNVRFGTVGPVLKGVEVKIAEDGEILVRGPNVMLGYYKNPELTKEVLEEDGWFHTGDIGCWEDERFLKITDRKKEMFKTSGGIYIAPQEIENRLKESPFIDQSIVCGEFKRFPSVIISPDFVFLKEYCRRKKIPFESADQIIYNQKIQVRIWKEIQKMNVNLDRPKKIKSFRLVPHVWTPETGELSPTLKLKRTVLKIKYQLIIEEIYS
ncbi:AMP-binding protein [Labilibaculum sp. A4]|uniref:AMP-binding protein n=1 Tax=Labilibaculum euxinus TaxID=2686357 RepID=A0A425YDS7_9BACT|nr:long-chain fatty acid--CoA ligase [Labilibaculum euxinus]MDQ1770948.1 long-chain fatty acid--CoA ligase [Labilibaculum euxinus]MUP38844.1 AMP-binding protein [Labilibaculum euxinus]MVB08049.1 AMP-binding protein [Labilibaculum euxinus]MWN76117.1 AMP-binding protein [Labilibaculum euxinus]